MSFQRTSSALGFGWQNEAMRVNRKAKSTAHKIKDLEGALIYWVGPGAMLNRLAAEHLRDHFKKSIEQQDDLGAEGSMHFKDLTPRWRREKYEAKLRGVEKMGIAFGEMVDNIEAIDSGGGKWKVGIKKSGKGKKTLNYISKLKLHQVAEIFEFGSVKQQARPIFMHFFMKWARDNVDEVLKPIVKHFFDKYYKLKGEWEGVNYGLDAMTRDIKVIYQGPDKSPEMTEGGDTTADTAIRNLDEGSFEDDDFLEDTQSLTVRDDLGELPLEDEFSAVDTFGDLSLDKYNTLLREYAKNMERFMMGQQSRGRASLEGAVRMNKIAWDPETEKYYLMADFYKMLEMRRHLGV